jgi:hypothetical protein
VEINKQPVINNHLTYEDWMDYFAAKKTNSVFKLWLKDKWEFYCKYFIIDEPEAIYICDKRTRSITECWKDVAENFIIEFKRVKGKKIFTLGSFELFKKVEE